MVPLPGANTRRLPVEAHFVGMKVCLGCHASQAESFKPHADGPHRPDAKGQVRLRKLPRPRIGAREGRRRTRRRRDHFVPAGRSIAHGRRKQRHLSHLPRARRPHPLARQHPRNARADVHELPHHHEDGVAQEPVKDRVRAGHLLPVPQGPARCRWRARRICRCAKAKWCARIATIRTAASPKRC